jgi:hypothetical protein
MEVALPLEKMSIKEKIQTMEAIWDDLCRKEDSIPSPSWHKKILKEREDSVKKGDDEFVNWNSAKKNIRNKIS